MADPRVDTWNVHRGRECLDEALADDAVVVLAAQLGADRIDEQRCSRAPDLLEGLGGWRLGRTFHTLARAGRRRIRKRPAS